MTEAQDLFARLGFDKSAPQPPQPVGLTGYLIDLFVSRLTDAQLSTRRKAGEYDRLRPQDLTGYHKMARGK